MDFRGLPVDDINPGECISLKDGRLDRPYAPQVFGPWSLGWFGPKFFVIMPIAFCLIETMGDSLIEHIMIPGSAMKAFL